MAAAALRGDLAQIYASLFMYADVDAAYGVVGVLFCVRVSICLRISREASTSMTIFCVMTMHEYYGETRLPMDFSKVVRRLQLLCSKDEF